MNIYSASIYKRNLKVNFSTEEEFFSAFFKLLYVIKKNVKLYGIFTSDQSFLFFISNSIFIKSYREIFLPTANQHWNDEKETNINVYCISFPLNCVFLIPNIVLTFRYSVDKLESRIVQGRYNIYYILYGNKHLWTSEFRMVTFWTIFC
jgi:hypothetical protein